MKTTTNKIALMAILLGAVGGIASAIGGTAHVAEPVTSIASAGSSNMCVVLASLHNDPAQRRAAMAATGCK